MADDVKLCKDCRHISAFTYPAHCKVAGPEDLVYGGHLWVKCSDARSEDGACGPDAKLWEARPYVDIHVKAADNVPRRWWQDIMDGFADAFRVLMFWRRDPYWSKPCPGYCGGKCPKCNGGPE